MIQKINNEILYRRSIDNIHGLAVYNLAEKINEIIDVLNSREGGISITPTSSSKQGIIPTHE